MSEKKKFDDFMNEPFIVASFLDSYLHGANSGKGSVGLVSRVYKGPWPFDVRTINAPVTCYHGDEDKAMSPLMPKIICTLVILDLFVIYQRCPLFVND